MGLNTWRHTLYNLFYANKNGSCKYIMLYSKYKTLEMINHIGYDYLTWSCERSALRPKCGRHPGSYQRHLSLSSSRTICTVMLFCLCPSSSSSSSAVSLTHDKLTLKPRHVDGHLTAPYLNGSVPSFWSPADLFSCVCAIFLPLPSEWPLRTLHW